MTQPEVGDQAMQIPVTRGDPSNPAQARAEAEHAQSPPDSAAAASDAPWAKVAAAGQSEERERRKEDAAMPSVPSFPVPLIIGPEPKLTSAPRGLPDAASTVPDTVLDGADLPGLVIRGASIRGDEHRYFGITRQDSMGIWALADGQAEAYLVCVADGVGSEPMSQFGSAKACALLREEAERKLPALLAAGQDRGLPGICQNMAERVAARLADYGRNLQIAPKFLSTTLVGAVIEAEPASAAGRGCVVFAVGDSTAFLLRDGTFYPLLDDPHDGMIASTGTSALPTSPGTVATCRIMIRPGDMLMVCTDGLSNPMRNAAVSSQFGQWWGSGSVPEVPEFGWQLSFRAKSYGDDRTAVCVWSV